jgi:hypothetical protein
VKHGISCLSGPIAAIVRSYLLGARYILMNRRSYLGGCAGAGLVALSGCLGTVAPHVARTASGPAFLMPSVRGDETEAFVPRNAHLARPIDLDVDSGSDLLGTVTVRGWLTGSRLVAANYNNSRSNRSGIAALDLDSDGDGTDEEKAQDYDSSRSNKPRSEVGDPDDDGDGVPTTRAQNHNSSRSNRSQPVAGDGDLDLDRAFAYLDGEAVVGETFVVSVPAVDLPGLDDAAARGDGADYLAAMVSSARATSPSSDETVLRDLTTPTVVRPVDAATPYLYTSSARDDDTPLASGWSETRLPGRGDAETEHAPVVGRAVATLDGGVRLPVLVYTQHLRSGGDHLFVAGWVVDDARLYTTAATALVAAGRTRVLSFTPDQVADTEAVRRATASLDERQRLGASAYQDGDDLYVRKRPGGRRSETEYQDGTDMYVRKRPGRMLCGPDGCPDADATGLDDAVRAALQPDPVTPGAGPDEPVHLFAVPVDAPLVHLASTVDGEAVASVGQPFRSLRGREQ